MKRSFYEMLGIVHDADQPQIDAAYAQATARLNAVTSRGVAAAVAETKLLNEGYRILSSPEQRARYDAKLHAAEAATPVVVFRDEAFRRRRIGMGAMVLTTILAIVGTLLYLRLSIRMEEVKVEHARAVAKHQEELATVKVIEVPHVQPPVVNISTETRK